MRDELDDNGGFMEKRLYKELAVGICGGPHLPPSLHLLLGATAAAGRSAATISPHQQTKTVVQQRRSRVSARRVLVEEGAKAAEKNPVGGRTQETKGEETKGDQPEIEAKEAEAAGARLRALAEEPQSLTALKEENESLKGENESLKEEIKKLKSREAAAVGNVAGSAGARPTLHTPVTPSASERAYSMGWLSNSISGLFGAPQLAASTGDTGDGASEPEQQVGAPRRQPSLLAVREGLSGDQDALAA